MKIEDIINQVAAAEPAPEKPSKKKPAAVKTVAAALTSGLNDDAQLRSYAARIGAACNIAALGFTTEDLVAKVREYETPYTGVVQ